MSRPDEHIAISVVTPSYNQGKFIEQTILSVLNQHYPNLEYIVVDGGSTDETLQILHKYQDRLRWISEPDHGQSDAINKGLRMAHGQILTYLNSDDLLLPGALEHVNNYFHQHLKHQHNLKIAFVAANGTGCRRTASAGSSLRPAA